MNFSFVLPTLGNGNLVLTFLESLERTTKWKNKIEVLFAIDEGKTDIIKFVCDRKYNFPIRFFERPATKDFTNDYYNFLANRATGDNIIAFNDDAWMRTNHWDAKILYTIKEYGWSIYMLDLPDTARMKYKHHFPCFPCVSRRGMNTLGWMLCRHVRMYPADQLTYAVYAQCGRVIPVNNILIEHEHILESDPSKNRFMEIYNEDMKTPIDLSQDMFKLSTTAASERLKKPNKLKRIFNIIKEA